MGTLFPQKKKIYILKKKNRKQPYPHYSTQSTYLCLNMSKNTYYCLLTKAFIFDKTANLCGDLDYFKSFSITIV